MSELIGLPGTNGKGRMFTEFGHSVSGLMRLFEKEGVSTAAGLNGSINVWKDDHGVYRAERHFYCKTVEGIITQSKAALKYWLNWNLPKLK